MGEVKKLSRHDMARIVAKKNEVSIKLAEKLIASFLDETASAAREGHEVSLRGWGVIERVWRKPKTRTVSLNGGPKVIPGRYSIRARFSASLRRTFSAIEAEAEA